MKRFERVFLIFVVSLQFLFIVYIFKVMPTTSLQLYQQVRFAERYEDITKLFIDEDRSHFAKANYEELQQIFSKNSPKRISQQSILQYEDEWIILDTAPGTFTNKLIDIKVIDGEQLKALKMILGESEAGTYRK